MNAYKVLRHYLINVWPMVYGLVMDSVMTN